MNLTSRDLDILHALGNAVRCMELSQIAALWWTPNLSGVKNAAKRLAKLTECELLRSEEILAHPLLQLSEPMIVWNPGDDPPHFAALSWRLQRRWTHHPVRRRVYYCSPRARALLGAAGHGKIKNHCQLTHDLHVAEVFAVYRRNWPEQAADWYGEDSQPPRFGEMRPDAVLAKQGMTYLAVEFGGRYPATRLAELHEYFARRELRYQIW